MWLRRVSLRLVKDELFSDNDHFSKHTPYRLAFREFGTCMGMGCWANRNSLLAGWKAEILSSWENVLKTETPEDLRPITQVMYAAALIPGGMLLAIFLFLGH